MLMWSTVTRSHDAFTWVGTVGTSEGGATQRKLPSRQGAGRDRPTEVPSVKFAVRAWVQKGGSLEGEFTGPPGGLSLGRRTADGYDIWRMAYREEIEAVAVFVQGREDRKSACDKNPGSHSELMII